MANPWKNFHTENHPSDIFNKEKYEFRINPNGDLDNWSDPLSLKPSSILDFVEKGVLVQYRSTGIVTLPKGYKFVDYSDDSKNWKDYDPRKALGFEKSYQFRGFSRFGEVRYTFEKYYPERLKDLIRYGVTVQYRLREYTHEERCSLWFKVNDGSWVRCLRYKSQKYFFIDESPVSRDANWFTGRQSSEVPPEEE